MLMVGRSWFCHRSRHCLPTLFGICTCAKSKAAACASRASEDGDGHRSGGTHVLGDDGPLLRPVLRNERQQLLVLRRLVERLLLEPLQ